MPTTIRDTVLTALKPRTLALYFLGFSAGLPFTLVFGTLSFWLRKAGVERADITMLSWMGLLFSFKFVWAPFVDQFRLPVLHRCLGKRRSWLLLAQIGIVLGLVGISNQCPSEGIGSIVPLALALAFFTATQDIAIDAFRIECAPANEQGILAAAYQGGYRTAMWVGSAGTLAVAAWLSVDPHYDLQAWQNAYKVMAGLGMVGMVTCLAMAEPQQTIKNWEYQGLRMWLRRAVVAPFRDFFRRFGKVSLLILGVISIYRIADIVQGAIANPFYVDMGYSEAQVALVSKSFGIPMTLAGATIGGLLVSRFGIRKILLLGAIIAASSNLTFAAVAMYGRTVWGLAAAIAADNLSGGIATSAFIAFLSSLTSTAFSATQYAMFSSLMSTIPKFLAGFSGTLVDLWGYAAFFVFTALLGIPTLIMLNVYLRYDTRRFADPGDNA